MARTEGLIHLDIIGGKPAIDRVIPLLRDSNEGVRWMARSKFRHLTGQILGADPATYEKWWKENREAFTPPR